MPDADDFVGRATSAHVCPDAVHLLDTNQSQRCYTPFLPGRIASPSKGTTTTKE
jgi:hypothetical protein